MTRSLSLRGRLTLIILLPLLVTALAAGAWQVQQAVRTAADVFDRSLLSAALAVSHDVSLSGGDALSRRTRDLLADTSGGRVYYHVYAPDGVIVAGYATPPVGIPGRAETVGPSYFSASYLGRPVSGVRLQNATEIDGFSGIFTTTVWQETALREAFVWQLARRAIITIAGLIAGLALVVWFGVRVGLRPLLDLEQAIAQRSGDELSPIRRSVPVEVRGIVETLNRLFSQVSLNMTAQNEFISNAAHQLRNPIAGVLSLAEAVHNAPDAAQARQRSGDLLEAARETADMAQKLLALERAKTISPISLHQDVVLTELLEDWVAGFRAGAPAQVRVGLDLAPDLGRLRCEPTMLREALTNLADNALCHGGPGLTAIDVQARRDQTGVEIVVTDDGRGLSEADLALAIQRFSQVSASSGSGLGLPIAETIVAGHGGTMELVSGAGGLRVVLWLPGAAGAESAR